MEPDGFVLNLSSFGSNNLLIMITTTYHKMEKYFLFFSPKINSYVYTLSISSHTY